MTITINIPITLDYVFFEDIAAIAGEGGINYWAHVRAEVDQPENPNADACWHYFVREVLEDRDDSPLGPCVELTPDLLALGAKRLIEGSIPVAHRVRAGLIRAVENNDTGDIDAEIADCIVQAALFNEIRYG